MKHGRELLTIGVGLVLGLVAIPVLAAERVPVTDPATLASMGFSPDARNVYMMTNVARGEEAADFGIGTSHPHYTGVQGATFQCRRNIAGSCQYIADGFTFQPQGTEIFATAECRARLDHLFRVSMPAHVFCWHSGEHHHWSRQHDRIGRRPVEFHRHWTDGRHPGLHLHGAPSIRLDGGPRHTEGPGTVEPPGQSSAGRRHLQ